jgi:copper chaperone CopZ
MRRGHCASRVEPALTKLTGVKAADASFESGRVVVVFENSKTRPAKFVEAIDGLGFKAGAPVQNRGGRRTGAAWHPGAQAMDMRDPVAWTCRARSAITPGGLHSHPISAAAPGEKGAPIRAFLRRDATLVADARLGSGETRRSWI